MSWVLFGVRWLLLLLLLANKFGFNTKTHKYCLLWYKVDHIRYVGSVCVYVWDKYK